MSKAKDLPSTLPMRQQIAKASADLKLSMRLAPILKPRATYKPRRSSPPQTIRRFGLSAKQAFKI